MPILQANNTQAPMVLRVNQQVLDRVSYLKQLEQKHIPAAIVPNVSEAIRLEKAYPATELPLYEAGGFSVQDAASQLAATLLDLSPNLKILDACAAPGGKTCHILECMPSSDLLAVDMNKNKTQKIKENLQRLRLKAIILKRR